MEECTIIYTHTHTRTRKLFQGIWSGTLVGVNALPTLPPGSVTVQFQSLRSKTIKLVSLLTRGVSGALEINFIELRPRFGHF